jgi:hypothetical protein
VDSTAAGANDGLTAGGAPKASGPRESKLTDNHIGGDATPQRHVEVVPVTHLSEPRTWHFLALIFGLQAGLLLLDATPRYMNEDSASYLWSVFQGGPFDRSWTYPAWFLRPILLLHSLNLVVYIQCALGVIPAWLAFRLVSPCGDRCSDIVAFMAAFAVLIERLALSYQRFFLADGWDWSWLRRLFFSASA